MRYKDITGLKFGSLTAIKFSHTYNRQAFWIYKCDCGKEHTARSNTITYEAKKHPNSNIPSCGCVELANKTKHGYRKAKDTHPLYKVWRSMLDRCYNKNCESYRFYGARGVTVCEEWRHDPKAFIEWALEHGWERGLVIDKDILCDKLNISPKVYSPNTVIFIPEILNLAFSNNRNNYGRHPNIKLSIEQCNSLLNKYDTGYSKTALSKEYGICYSSVRKIIDKREHTKRINELLEQIDRRVCQ